MKPRTFRKLEKHPDYDEIVQLTEDGALMIRITEMLYERYPKDKSKHLNHPYLYAWRLQEFPHLAGKRADIKTKIQTKTTMQKTKKKSLMN